MRVRSTPWISAERVTFDAGSTSAMGWLYQTVAPLSLPEGPACHRHLKGSDPFCSRCAKRGLTPFCSRCAKRGLTLGWSQGWQDPPRASMDAPGDPRIYRELLARALEGDGEAFGAFYRRHVRRITAFHLARTHEAQDAADLTAETFAAALAALHRYDPARGEP